MARIDIAEEKWARKVRSARDKWLAMVKDASSLEAYVQGIADFIGVDPATVRASFPARNWAEFQKNADKYVDAWIEKVTRAAERKKWSKGYIRAFTKG